MSVVQQRFRTGIGRLAASRFVETGRLHLVVLALLAAQFVIVQLSTQPLFGDAPRNLHWGILTADQPGFLFGGLDLYERNKGFRPDPETLSEYDFWKNGYGSFHRWWGPLAPVLFAGVWLLTGSYTLMQLVVPLAGAGTVLLVYAWTQALLDKRAALLAAAFLGCFPLFREFSSTAYTETLSALVLTAALAAYWRGWTVPMIIFGALCAYTKLDLLFLYVGVVGISLLFVLMKRRNMPLEQGVVPRFRDVRYHLIALAGPILLAAPWIWLHYLGAGATGPTRGLSGSLFLQIVPQMIGLLFYIPWYGALITLGAIVAPVIVGLRSGRFSPHLVLLLCAWIGLGVIVLLVYAATPGAGNSPRVIIPALPALAILFAGGFERLATVWRRRIGFYLIVLFMLINSITIGYEARAGELRALQPVWAALREQPRGFVLTENYWETILFTRQPATWFEFDETFEHNIMTNAANFDRYVTQNPIRYVILPTERGLASPDVRAYLNTHARRDVFGAYVLYSLR